MSDEQQYQDDPDALQAQQFQDPQIASPYDEQQVYEGPEEVEYQNDDQYADGGEQGEYHESYPGPDDYQEQEHVQDTGYTPQGSLENEQYQQHASGPDPATVPDPTSAPPLESEPSAGSSQAQAQSVSESLAAVPQEQQPQTPPPAAQMVSASASSDSNIPQVIVTRTSSQDQGVSRPDSPAVDQQALALQQTAPQVIIVPSVASADPQVIVQTQSPSPPLPTVQPVVQATQPVVQTTQPPQSLAAQQVPMIPFQGTYSYTASQEDYIEQNVINTVWSNVSEALIGSPPATSTPLVGPVASQPSTSSQTRSAQSPTRTPRAQPSGGATTRSPRTSHTSRVPVPGGPSSSSTRHSPPRAGPSRHSPPRPQPGSGSPPTPTSPPPPSRRNSTFMHPTPVTTPIVEHPEFEYESVRGHARNDSVQSEMSDRPPTPPPAHTKPASVRSRPPSIYVPPGNGQGMVYNANSPDNLVLHAPVPSSSRIQPAPPLQAAVFDHHYSGQPHITRRAASTGHSGIPVEHARPAMERRGQSYHEQSVYQQAQYVPQQSRGGRGNGSPRRTQLHTSVPVGGLVDGRAMHASTGSAEVDFGPGGGQMHLSPDILSFKGAVRGEADVLRAEGEGLVRQGEGLVHRGEGMVENRLLQERQRGESLMRQGEGMLQQERQRGENLVRQGESMLQQEVQRGEGLVRQGEGLVQQGESRLQQEMQRGEGLVHQGEGLLQQQLSRGNSMYSQGLNAIRNGEDAYTRSADMLRQGIDTVRQGADTIRQGAQVTPGRAVSFMENTMGTLTHGVNANTLAASAGSLAAGYIMGNGANLAGNGGDGTRGMGNGAPQTPGMTAEAHLSRASGLDTFIPYAGSVGPKTPAERTLEERLLPTLRNAREALSKARVQATVNGWSLNVAIGAQILLGALTTGIAAATTGKKTSIVTSILGGISTLAASYLAKARGSGEPERSSGLAKELENFVRDCDAFVLDHGHKKAGYDDGLEMSEHVEEYRRRFEILMGHNGDQVGDQVEEKRAMGRGHVGMSGSAGSRDSGVAFGTANGHVGTGTGHVGVGGGGGAGHVGVGNGTARVWG